MVSPPDKNQGNVDQGLFGIDTGVSDDGESVGFCTSALFLEPAAQMKELCAPYISRRTTTGWQTTNPFPRYCGSDRGVGPSQIGIHAFLSPSFDQAVFTMLESASCVIPPLDPTAPLPGQKPAPLYLDPKTRTAQVWGQPLDPPLSQIQYDFLALLAAHPGRVYTRDEIIRALWPNEDLSGISDDAINALVHRLRQRLREREPNHEFIGTLRGYGFRLDLP
jgi:hypothetical protein